MSKYGPYHRTGEPGGPGCEVRTLKITMKDKDGTMVPSLLVDAGHGSELEMLRTIAERIGIRWGHDDLGWWAMVPTGE